MVICKKVVSKGWCKESRGLKFRIYEGIVLVYVATIKGLICSFVFAYTKSKSSHDATHSMPV